MPAESRHIYHLQVNDMDIAASFSEREVREICLPLLYEWTRRQQATARRYVVFIAAPPGCGKTVLAGFLEYLSRSTPGITPLQAIGMDGFHYPQAYLQAHKTVRDKETVSLLSIKGAPETFDTSLLYDHLKRLQEDQLFWPGYSRRTHDPVPDAITVREKIVLVEGNYLLLNREPWKRMKELCDYSVFLQEDAEVLKERLIARKTAGGMKPADAIQWYERSDRRNIDIVLKESMPADCVISFSGDTEHIRSKADMTTDND
jgi:pantothenate kinase